MSKRLSTTFACLLLCGLLAMPAAQAAAADGKTSKTAASQAAPANENLPRIAILGTGGTIADSSGAATRLAGSKTADLTAEQLIAAVPGLKDFARISTEQVANINSHEMTTKLWLKLANRANELLSGDTDGIVVTHGTDTMEETAYFLNLTVKSPKPLVMVGAMRPPMSLGADGPLNLLQAVAVAGSKDARGKGTLLVMNGEINGAREVTKTNTQQPETFRSYDMGFLGYVVDNVPDFYRTSLRKHSTDSEFDVSGLATLPKVEIVYTYVDAGLGAVKGVVADKPDGIVVAGMGDGSIAPSMLGILRDAAAQGIAIVRSSRAGTGKIKYDAREGDDVGFVASDSLNPQKARVLLMLALTKTKDPKELRRIFATY
ncbi:MAG: asparaginase [Desulfovibrio sp.]|jgi:L-asparaginase|nr:asparaginase [Desulfovibrio sp.]